MTTLPSPNTMVLNDRAWRNGIFELLNSLYAIVDFAVMDRDQHVQRWLYNTGHTWVGDPAEPVPFVGAPLHRVHVQDRKWQEKMFASLKEDEKRYAAYHAYRDKTIRGVQFLFTYEPSRLYLLCMHTEFRLKDSAKAQDVDINAPPDSASIFSLYKESQEARALLEIIFPHIKQTASEWRAEYARNL